MITKENAKELQLLAAKRKMLNHQAKILARAEAMVAQPEMQYREVRLSRVRIQLDKLDEMLMSENDPAKLDRLASAQARLSEQERILAGRALPGSLKPVAPRKSSHTAPVEPDEPA